MFGFNMFPHEGGIPRTFTATYRCFSVSMLPGQERQDVDKGGKIIMPPSALDQLTRLNIQYPMLFKLTNKRTDRETHCGVLEFVADEGRIYLPYWMLTNLLLEEGGLVHLENVSLPVATFAKFEPQHVDFLDISNPKAVLENNLRNFACITSGDMLAIKYNEKVYELRVLESKPGRAVSIIECDMNVEFAPPVGYQEPQAQMPQTAHTQDEEMPVDAIDYIDHSKFRAFSGGGNRLDGKKRGQEGEDMAIEPHEMKRGIPNYDFKKGKITFIRVSRNTNGNGKDKDKDQDGPDFAAFSGEGRTLKTKNTRKV